MRNRMRNRRFPSCETRAPRAVSPAMRPFPDAELKATDGQVGFNEATGRTLRITLTLLSYLTLPIVAFISLPEPLKPLCMLAAVFSGYQVLNYGDRS
jgi:hypothetical protein